jgi:hypothetical protein
MAVGLRLTDNWLTTTHKKYNSQYPHYCVVIYLNYICNPIRNSYNLADQYQITSTIEGGGEETLWPEFASELYRPSDRRLSAKFVPTFEGAIWSAWRIPTAVYTIE